MNLFNVNTILLVLSMESLTQKETGERILSISEDGPCGSNFTFIMGKFTLLWSYYNPWVASYSVYSSVHSAQE